MSRNLKVALSSFESELDAVLTQVYAVTIPIKDRTLQRLKGLLINTFNKFAHFSGNNWNKVAREDKLKIKNLYGEYISNTETAAAYLGITLIIPREIGQFASEAIADEESGLGTTLVDEQSEKVVEKNSKEKDIPAQSTSIETPKAENKAISAEKMQEETPPISTTMPMSKAEFIKIASGLIPEFDGKPEELQRFLDAVELLVSIAEGNDCVQFLKTRLGPKARSYITTEVTTVNQLTQALKDNIKPVDSDIIKSRLTALKCDRMQLHEFSTKVEELADQFQQALTVETGNADIAKKQTQKEIVKLCRANARTDIAKAVIASSTFNSPKEVIAKFVTEAAEERKEATVLYMKRRQSWNKRSTYRNSNNYRNFNRSNYNEYRTRGGPRTNRGRGFISRGNHNRNDTERYRRNNNSNDRNISGRQQRFVRYMSEEEQGNEGRPQNVQLGENIENLITTIQRRR